MVQYYSVKPKVDSISNIILCGSESKFPNMDVFFSQKLKLPVNRLASPHFNAVDSTTFIDYASLFGLCLWENKKNVFNFLPTKKECKVKKSVKAKPQVGLSLPKFTLGTKAKLVLPVFVVMILFSAGFAYSKFDSLAYKLNHQREVLAASADAKERVEAFRALKVRVASEKQTVQALQDKQVKVSYVLALLSEHLKRPIQPIELTVERGKMQMKAYSESPSTLDQFISIVTDIREFDEVTVKVIRKSPQKYDSRIYFELQLTLNALF